LVTKKNDITIIKEKRKEKKENVLHGRKRKEKNEYV
jgi:hypothetical protein